MIMLSFYLDVAEVTSRPVTFVTLSGNELTADAFASGAQSGSGVNVQTVTAGFQTVNNTANLNGAVDRTLLHHDLAVDVHTLDGDEGSTRAFGRPGSDTCENNSCKCTMSSN